MTALYRFRPIIGFISALLTAAVSILLFFVISIACSHGGVAPDLLPPAGVYSVSLENTLFCALFTLMMLNALLSCLWTQHPVWAGLFAAAAAAGAVDSAVKLIGNGEANAIPLLIYCLIALIVSVIAVFTRTRELWEGVERIRPAAWIDALLGLALFIPNFLPIPLDFLENLNGKLGAVLGIAFILALAARHIYIVKTLIDDRKNAV